MQLDGFRELIMIILVNNYSFKELFIIKIICMQLLEFLSYTNNNKDNNNHNHNNDIINNNNR